MLKFCSPLALVLLEFLIPDHCLHLHFFYQAADAVHLYAHVSFSFASFMFPYI